MRQAALASLAAALPVAMPSTQDGEEVRRTGMWAAATAVMALLHVGGLIAAVILHPATRPVPSAPAMMIELAPMPAPAAVEPAPAPLPPEPVTPKPREAPPPMVKTAKPALLKPKPNPIPPSQAHVDVPEAAETPAVPPTSPGQNTPTSAPAPQARSTPASQQAVGNWYGRLQAHLESRKRYPRAAQSRRQEGVATVRFVLDRLGNVLSARLEQSAGHALLDEESMELVGRAQPLPPPPPEVTGERIEVSVPIEFFLK